MDFVVGLATEADIEEVRKLILNKLKDREQILTDPPANVVVENIGVSSIDIKVLFWIDILKSKTEKADTLGHPIRSQIIREVKDLLLENGYSLPSNVVEHKMYDSKIPITVSLTSEK